MRNMLTIRMCLHGKLILELYIVHTSSLKLLQLFPVIYTDGSEESTIEKDI